MIKTLDIPMVFGTTLNKNDNYTPTHENDAIMRPYSWSPYADAWINWYGMVKPSYVAYISDDKVISATLYLHNETTTNTMTANVWRILRNATDQASYATYDGANGWANYGASGAGDKSGTIQSANVSILPNRWMAIPLVLSAFLEAKSANQCLLLGIEHGGATVTYDWQITNANQVANTPFIRIEYDQPANPMPIFF